MKRKEIVAKIDEILKDEKELRRMLDETFKFMDKDKNGQLDINETTDFVVYMIEVMKVPMDFDSDLIKEFMGKFDVDKDGTISKEELYPALKLLIIEWRDYLNEDKSPE